MKLETLLLLSAVGAGETESTETEPTNTEATGEATTSAEGKEDGEKAAKVEKPKMPTQNGVTRPRPETKCGKVWEIADKMSAAKNGPVAIGDLLVETDKLELNQGNVRCEYAAWRKFFGVVGRVMSEKQIAEKAEKEAAKAAKVAEKEAAKKAREEEKAAKKAEREAEKAKKADEKKKEAEAKAEAKAKAKAEKEAKAAEAKAKKEEAAKAKAAAEANAAKK